MTTKAARGDELMRVVELRGYEYASIGTLAKNYELSYKCMVELIGRLQETHEVRVLELGPRQTRVNVADFRRALLDCVPVRTSIR